VIDVKRVLEDESDRFHLEPGAHDRLSRRRDCKRRNDRIAAGVLAFIVLLAAAGSFFVADRARNLPAQGGRIDPSNVSTLRPAWSADLDGVVSFMGASGDRIPYPPTVAGDSVYVGTVMHWPPTLSPGPGPVYPHFDGTLYSFPTSCSSTVGRCAPTWKASVDGGVAYPPTVSDGRVFVTTTGGKLYGFPAGCARPCSVRSPGAWAADVGTGFYASPVVVDGMVYGIDASNGTLYAFRADQVCKRTCEPAWTASLGGGIGRDLEGNLDCKRGLWSCVSVAPAVADDVVFATSAAGLGERLQAFDAGSGNLLWRGTPFAVYGGAEQFREYPQRFLTPAIAGDVVFVAQPSVEAYATDCGRTGATCRPLWTGSGSGDIQVAASGGMAITASGEDGGLSAYPTTCIVGTGVLCTPAWRQTGGETWTNPIVIGEGSLLYGSFDDDEVRTVSLSCQPDDGYGGYCDATWTADVPQPGAPVISGGVVYVGSGQGRVFAFPAQCGTARCTPLWTGSGSAEVSTPAVTDRAIFVAHDDGRLQAFTLGSEEGVTASSSARPTAIFYAAVAGLAVGALLIRRRRRRST
jgi:outer membrane protein assembly factor BamB